MREVYIVGYHNYHFAKSLVVGEIVFQDFCLDFGAIDALILTSKHAALALEENAKKYPSMHVWKDKPSYVIGNGTAKSVLELGGRVECISHQANGRAFALELAKQIDPTLRLAYFRAEHIVSGLDEILKRAGLNLEVYIAYKSSPLVLPPSLRPPPQSILLFTAPSAYYNFVSNFAWDKSYRAVALGESTYGAFEKGILSEISPYQEIQKAYFALQEP